MRLLPAPLLWAGILIAALAGLWSCGSIAFTSFARPCRRTTVREDRAPCFLAAPRNKKAQALADPPRGTILDSRLAGYNDGCLVADGSLFGVTRRMRMLAS